MLNQVPIIGGTADTGIGISGTNLGVKTYTMNNIATYAMGTTFDDNATRDIFDSTLTGTNAISGPAIGDYQPEEAEFGETLDEFLAGELAKGINGTWTLVTNDTNMPPTTPPTTPNFLINWSLSFGRGLTADNDVIAAGDQRQRVIGWSPARSPTTYSTTVPSSPVGIGPGVVMAEDNTLGQYSPYEGRIYAAFVGYYNVTIDGIKNPADQHRHLPDRTPTTTAGPGATRSRSTTTRATCDGSPGRTSRISTTTSSTGQSQYQPEIAVDPTTGTVVMSWRDARNDPANTLVATYIATSIDGGNTFSAQVYANPPSTAIDAITGQTDVLGPEADNATAADNAVERHLRLRHLDGPGRVRRPGLPGVGRQLRRGHARQRRRRRQRPVHLLPADGHRGRAADRQQHHGADPAVHRRPDGYQQAQQTGKSSFTVTFDRPINPPAAPSPPSPPPTSRSSTTIPPSATPPSRSTS